MHAVVSSRAVRGGVRGRRARWVTAALAVAALTSGASVAVAAPAAAAQAPEASAQDPLHCPSAACSRAARNMGQPSDTALDSTGKTLYVADDSGAGTLWKVDAATGKKSEDPVATGIGSAEIALADDHTAYLADFNSDKLWRVNLDTGQKHEITTVKNPESMVLDGHGHAYVASGAGSYTLYRIDLTEEEMPEDQRKQIVTDRVGDLTGLALDGQGNAYVTDFTGGILYKVSQATGRKTKIADVPRANYIALDGHGHAYLTSRTEDGVLYRVDLTKEPGTATAEKVVTGLGNPYSVHLDHAGNALITDRTGGNVWRVSHLDGGAPPPPPPGETKVELHPVAHITAVPGGSAVPRVNVTNTGGKRIGNQDVRLKLGPEGVKWGFNVVYQDRDGRTVETPCRVVEGDPGTSLCKDVPLNLDPGQSVELRTEVGTSRGLKPCDMPSITWSIAGTSAKSDWVMKNEDGSPSRC
ncbi:hypothetical protein [Streptomyces flavidovirens]|uniref:Uncharacterized protein n=1 Tax=Streptomyces flavidovirens TaxID=67298 RepID=A0ABW6RJH8_9ACTN